MNVQVIADPAGRLIEASPALPGSRHDIAAAREHGILDAVAATAIDTVADTVADTGYQGAGPAVRVPQRRRRLDPDTGHYRPLSGNHKAATGGGADVLRRLAVTATTRPAGRSGSHRPRALTRRRTLRRRGGRSRSRRTPQR